MPDFDFHAIREMEADHEQINELGRALDAVTAERDALAAQLAAARAALEHIAEYWNRSENDTAMNDALYHMIDTAEVALSATPPPIVAELARLRKVAEAASIIQGYEDFESNFGKLGADLDAALAALEGGED